MSYFSRLTDIVTCNLTEILSRSDDPPAALQEIISEMEEGVAGAKRSVATADANRQRLQQEIRDQKSQQEMWAEKAREALKSGEESDARTFLFRKQETEDLTAGLEQQLTAAEATWNHLTTTLRALEARLVDAERKRKEFESSEGGMQSVATGRPQTAASGGGDERSRRVDDELAALKRELNQSSD